MTIPRETKAKHQRAYEALSTYGLWRSPSQPMECDCIVSAGFMKYVSAIAATLTYDALAAFIDWMKPDE